MSMILGCVMSLVCIVLPPKSGRLLWGNLEPGEYRVGLRVITLLDTSRRGDRREGKPVDLVLWYPGETTGEGEAMTFGGYLRLSYGERSFSEAELGEQLVSEISSDPQTVDRQTVDGILASGMLAVQDLAPREGEYPLLLWSARRGTVAAQSVLSEFLASHGYVVAFTRPHLSAPPPPYEITSMQIKGKVLEDNIRDMEVAVSFLRSVHPVGLTSATAVMSWSYAGESAVIYQMRNPEVRLVMSFSSNVLDGWVYQSKDELSKLESRRLDVPYVLMSEEIGANGRSRPVPSMLDRLPVRSYFIRFDALAHGNFNVLEGMIPATAGISSVVRWSKGGLMGQLGYETVARYALHFLDSYLKPGDGDVDPLKEWDWSTGLPENFVRISAHGGANGER